MRTKLVLLAPLAVLALSSNAIAYSGAEFFADNNQFSRGYAWATLEYRLTIGSEATVAQMEAASECIRNAGIDSEMFHTAVRAFIQGDLSSMTQPAVVAVLRASLELCPMEQE